MLDPFVGSGTTVIAAEKTGRRAYALELDPIYCDTVIRRWEAYSGKHAVHVETGYCFEEREELSLSTSDAEGPELPRDGELIDPEV